MPADGVADAQRPLALEVAPGPPADAQRPLAQPAGDPRCELCNRYVTQGHLKSDRHLRNVAAAALAPVPAVPVPASLAHPRCP